MGFFNKSKSKDALRPLSEEEIQKKLYGGLKVVASPKYKQEEKKESYSHSKVTLPEVAYAEKESVKEEQPALKEHKSHFSKTDGAYLPQNDLFSQNYDDESSLSQEEAVEEELSVEDSLVSEEITELNDLADPKEQEREKSIMARLAEIAEQEKKKEAELKAASFPRPELIGKPHSETKKVVAVKSVEKKTVTAKKKERNLFFVKLAALSVVFGKVILSFFSKVSFGAINITLRALKIIDFRKARTRRIIYWIVGIFGLVFLFGGIHLLNVKREAAMKAPRKNKVVVAPEETKNANSKPAVQATVKKVVVNNEVLSKNSEAEKKKKTETVASEVKETQVKREETQSAVVAEDASNGAGRYVIQIATYAGPKDAERVVNQLKEARLDSFMKALTRSSGKVYYSVFLGRYQDFQEAQEAFAKFRKNEAATQFEDAFIRTLNS